MNQGLIKRINGYYTVGDEYFAYKIPALLRATQTGQHPVWKFHSDVYSKLDWQKDLDISLDTLYQMRAKQLREKYDYLILSFSGGSDSTTMLKAFIDSKTHLDEIYVSWPFKATVGKYKISADDLRPENINSEWDLTILPQLTELVKLLPKTKFTIDDWSDEIESIKIEENFGETAGDHLNPGWRLKIPRIQENEKRLIQKGKKTATIYGIDKPQLVFKDGKLYCYFLDKLANIKYFSVFTERNTEFFYWTPDLPEITLVQARVIYNYLKLNPKQLSFVNNLGPVTSEKKFLYDKICRKLIYEDYTKYNFFQAKKGTSVIFNEYDYFLWSNKNLTLMKSWEYELKNLISSIDKKYIEYRNDHLKDIVGFIDGMYCLGEITVL